MESRNQVHLVPYIAAKGYECQNFEERYVPRKSGRMLVLKHLDFLRRAVHAYLLSVFRYLYSNQSIPRKRPKGHILVFWQPAYS
jgi:hypothetical protein